MRRQRRAGRLHKILQLEEEEVNKQPLEEREGGVKVSDMKNHCLTRRIEARFQLRFGEIRNSSIGKHRGNILDWCKAGLKLGAV